jgi:hypothetical protein
VPSTLLNLFYLKGKAWNGHGKSRKGNGMAWNDMERKGKAQKIEVCANGVVKNEKW